MTPYIRLLVFCVGLCVWVHTVQADITSNLVLWLKMDEGTGGASTALTDWGSGGHTTNFSSTTFPDWLTGGMPNCHANACLVFNGVDDRVRTISANDLSPTNGAGQDTPFTITVWLRITSTAATQRVIAKYNTVPEWYLSISGNTLYMQYFSGGDGGTYIGRSAPLSTTATWIHVATTYSGSETAAGIKLYVNGVRVDDTDANVGTYTGVTRGADNMDIGTFLNTGGNDPYGGRMDELKIFTRELTAADILEDATGTPAVVGGLRRPPLVY